MRTVAPLANARAAAIVGVVVGSRMRRDVRRERGEGLVPDAAAAPATVSGEPPSVSHWSPRVPGRPRGKARTREPGDLPAA
jgi:hypothetical protein